MVHGVLRRLMGYRMGVWDAGGLLVTVREFKVAKWGSWDAERGSWSVGRGLRSAGRV